MKWMMRSTRATPTDPCHAPAIGALGRHWYPETSRNCVGLPGKLRAGGVQEIKGTNGDYECTECTMPGRTRRPLVMVLSPMRAPIRSGSPSWLEHCELRVHPIVIAGSSERYSPPPPIDRTIFHIPDGQRQPCPSPSLSWLRSGSKSNAIPQECIDQALPPRMRRTFKHPPNKSSPSARILSIP